MVTNIFLFVSTVVFILTLIDVLLSDAQKSYISKRTTEFWDFLDNLKTGAPILTFFRRRLVQQIFVLLLISCVILYVSIFITSANGNIGDISANSFIYIPVISIALLLLWKGSSIIAFTVAPGKGIAVRMALILIGVALFPFIMYGIGEIFFKRSYYYGINLSAAFAYIIALGSAFLFVIPFVIIIATASFIALIEFVVRRIAEYPKGPILAVSALFGAILAFIKVFA